MSLRPNRNGLGDLSLNYAPVVIRACWFVCTEAELWTPPEIKLVPGLTATIQIGDPTSLADLLFAGPKTP